MEDFYRVLLRVRPSTLGSTLKKVFGIKRRIVNTDSGERFYVDPVSHFGFEVLSTHTYEPSLTSLVRELLRPGDTFVDVGGNEGYFSVIASKQVGVNGQVFCIEPQSRLQPVIRENLLLNLATNVQVEALAFSDKSGRVSLHLSADVNSGGTSLYKHWRSKALTEEVQSLTLDSYFDVRMPGTIRLVKLDCEGAELPILRGAKKMLSEQRVQFFSVDYHPQIAGEDSAREIDRLLRAAGYLVSAAASGIWVYHLPGLESELKNLGPCRTIPPLCTL